MRLPVPIPARDESVVAHWIVASDDDRDVIVSRLQNESAWPWTVEVERAPQGSDHDEVLSVAMMSALRAVPSVRDVLRNDSGVWLVSGRPWGFALARAAGLVVGEHPVGVPADSHS